MFFYDEFQLIAYRVPTDRSLDAGKECLSDRLADYEKELPSGDALRRLLRILAVVDVARMAIKGATTQHTLKVFVVPEFYFRPKTSEPARSYSKQDKERIIQALKYVFQDEDFKSWLLVLGTIVWTEKAEGVLQAAGIQDDAKLNTAKRGDVVWNTAIVIEGGTDKVTTFDKENYDAADNIDLKYRPGVTGTNSLSPFDKLNPGNKETLATYFNGLKRDNRSKLIVKVGHNLNFGIELCADHALGVLKTAYDEHCKKLGQNTPAPALDFQILTACGMPVHPASVVIGANQCILRVDGNSHCSFSNGKPEPEPDFSEIERVVSVDKPGNKTLCTQYSQEHKGAWEKLNKPPYRSIALDANPDSALKVPTDQEVALRYAVGNAEPVPKPLDDAYPQCVVIYRPVRFGHVQPQDA